jgi:betaine reductase
VPFLGHALDAIRAGEMTRAMIIGKGSLFLGRLTNLADGASFIVEKPETRETDKTQAASLTRDDVKSAILEALSDLAASLRK